MRWTEPATPLRLSYRRAETAGFWIVMATLAATISATWATVVHARAPWAWGVAAATVLLAPGLVWPAWFERGVWFWNGCTRRVAIVLRRWVLTVCYFTVIACVGRAGSSLTDRRDGSGWTPVHPAPEADLRTLVSVCRRHHAWAIALTPVVALLVLLQEDRGDALPPSSTYTLY